MSRFAAFCVCAALLFLASCRSAESPSGSQERAGVRPPGEAPGATPPKNTANWTIAFEAAEPLPVHKPAAFIARVTDAAGKAVEGAEVEISLVMTTMDMGENKARLTEAEPGVYAGRATFTMAGPWRVDVKATKSADVATRAFSYNLK